MADKYNILVDQRCDYRQQFTWQDANGTPIDLTNYSIRSFIRSTPQATNIVAAFTGSILTPATSGTFQLSLSPSGSQNLTGSIYFYDIEMTGNNNVVRLLEGKVSVSPNVTR